MPPMQIVYLVICCRAYETKVWSGFCGLSYLADAEAKGLLTDNNNSRYLPSTHIARFESYPSKQEPTHALPMVNCEPSIE